MLAGRWPSVSGGAERGVRDGRAGPGRAGRGAVLGRWSRPPASPVCSVSSPGPPRRKEEPSPGQERAGSAPPPRCAPRGPSASLVQWFLTVQQFSSIIVKCLGPLDQRGPGIGRQRRRPGATRSGGTAGPAPGRRSRSQSRSRSRGPAGAARSGPAPQHLGRAARPGRAGPRTRRWPRVPLRGWRKEQSQCKCLKKNKVIACPVGTEEFNNLKGTGRINPAAAAAVSWLC
ncbi:translation initiation factor IF-2 [Corvus kubaryi]|uniref:translation initiation factor IF-2 n=1 Tax=Corvus kubaryi TaxID=68294 RepID=UPI001C055410|nr:translation initiation factor IF-2 [Corvus kubaryi]